MKYLLLLFGLLLCAGSAQATQVTVTQLTSYPCAGASCTAPASLAAGSYATVQTGTGINIDVGILLSTGTATHQVICYDGSQWWPVGTTIDTDSSVMAGRTGTRLTPGSGCMYYAVYRSAGSGVPDLIRISTDIHR